jgi:uncharacterized protein
MLLSAFIMGIAGSLHCAGMCSPLALTVTNTNSVALVNRMFYNLGRITTYGLLGAITVTVGYLFPISEFQNLLSILLGLTLIILAVTGMTGMQLRFITRTVVKFTAVLKKAFAKFLYKKNPGSMMILGSLNGLLPCGLTFLALSLCVTLTTPIEGFAHMFLFGIGTLPVMLGLVSAIDLIKNKLHWNIKHVTTGLMVVSGILLIARVFLLHDTANHNHELNLVDIVICR